MVDQAKSILSLLEKLVTSRYALVIVVAALVASSVILFVPSARLDSLGFIDLQQTARAVPETAFLISLSLLLAGVLITVISWVNTVICSIMRQISVRKAQKTFFRNLTSAEQAVLSRYIKGRTRTLNFYSDDPTIIDLARRGFLHQLAMHERFQTDSRNRAPFAIEDVAWEYLIKHPELVCREEKPKPK